MTTKKCVYVLSETDGAKYKLVMQGDVQLLTARKVKRYLEKATGIHASKLSIRFNELDIRDDMDGREMGLFDGAVLHVRHPANSAPRGARVAAGGESSVAAAREDTGVRSMFAASQDSALRQPTVASAGGDTPVQPSVPTSALTRSATAVRTTREVQLSPAAGPSPASSHATRPIDQALRDGSEFTHHAGEQSPDVDVRLYTARTPSVSMPRTVVQGSLHPYGDSIVSRSASHSDAVASHSASASAARDDDVARRQGSSSSRPASRRVAASVEEMEDELEAYREENETLRNMLYDAERRAATSASHAHLEEQLHRVRAQLAEADEAIEQMREETAATTAEEFRAREEEMHAELTHLRHELAQVKRDAARKADAHQSELASLKAELNQAHTELTARNAPLRAAETTKSARYPEATAPLESLTALALTSLAQALRVGPIELDETNTAVVTVAADLTLLVTLDPTSGRLFLYATLLSELPETAAKKLKLYESVLEGALLGKDMAGASVGVSKESNLVLMSTWIDVRFCNPAAFNAMADPFCQAVRYWISVAESLAYD